MEIKAALSQIKDFRREHGKKHALVDILLLCVIGFICGHTDIEDIVFWAEYEIERLRKFLELKNGIPSADTILRVLAHIDSKQFERIFTEWTKDYFKAQPPEKDELEIVAIDGKTVRNSNRIHGKKGIHIVSAWADRLGIVLSQMKTDEKTNEITVIPELLELMDLKGMIVTIDAMGCQKEITKKISEKKSDYVITLKANQSSMHDEVKSFFEMKDNETYCKDYEIQKWSCDIQKDHGRIEKREYYLCTHISWLESRSEWSNLNAIGMVSCKRKTLSGESTDIRYFITSLTDVRKAGKAMRAHWGIENKLHWTLDVTFDEDYSRIRKDHAAQNTAILRKITMNLIKRAPEPVRKKQTKKKASMKQKLGLCMINDDYLFSVLQLF